MGVLTRVAVLPSPPLLVPELTVRASPAIEKVRSACLRAVSSLTDITAEWVVVGADLCGPKWMGPETSGTFAGFGAEVTVSLGETVRTSASDPLLPLPALVTGWLREEAGARRADLRLLSPEAAPEACCSEGTRLCGQAEVLLVLADGTNRRDSRSPYHPDERAAGFDTLIRTALAEADTSALREMDPTMAAELGVTGRAPLQAMAAAVDTASGVWSSELLYSDTPFGVTYHVAVWSRQDV